MRRVSRLVTQEEISEKASLWLAKIERGLSPEEEKQVKAWLAMDPRNKAELFEMVALWDQMSSMSMLGELIPRTKQRSLWKPLGIAAAFLLAISVPLSLVLDDRPSSQTPAQTVRLGESRYNTPVGDQSTIYLNEGSVVQLNTDTRLEVSMLPNLRILTLERGEIHIDVAHDPDRPLRVFARGRVIEAVGTSFNVRIAASDELEVIVTEGKVHVGIDSSSKTVSRLKHTPLPLIAENERVRLGEDEDQIEVLEPDEIEVKLSWREGNLVFRGESLANAVTEVGRYTHMEFVIQSDDLRKLRVAGLFKAGDVEGFLASLRANFDIVDQRVGNTTILLTQRVQPPLDPENQK